MATWLFQGNPRLWPVLDALTESRATGEPIRSWSAVRYLDAIQPGDGALLWVSGSAAGVYAVGRVTSPPEPSPLEHGWADRAPRARRHHVVGLELRPLDQPVSRAELRADARFASAAIIRQPRSGNPFPVTDREWAAVAERLP